MSSVNASSVFTSQSARSLTSEIKTAPANLKVINIIFNYAHSCVSLASWNHTKQRVDLNNTLLTIVADQRGLQTLTRAQSTR